MKKQFVLSAVLVLFAGVLAANGAQTIRELWDGLPSGSLSGAASGPTTYGFYPNAAIKWTVNSADPAATNALRVNSADDILGWMIGRYDVLPETSGDPGTMALVGGNTNGWDSGSWATRYLAIGSRINTAADGVYYFSARLIKRGLWWGSDLDPTIATNNYGADDAALGLGFASGNNAAATFVGAGFTRSFAANGGGGYLTEDGGMDIGDTVYITQGTLGQAGYTNHPADSGGPYYVRAYGWPQWVTGYLGGYPYMEQAYVNGGFLVGKLTTSAAGNDLLEVYTFIDGEIVPMDDTGVFWDVTYSFNTSVSLNYLLVWMHGNNNANPCWIDGIRVGTTWAEVIGVETVGPPSLNESDPIYEGTPLTFSIAAYLGATNDTSAYVWRKGGSPIPGATNATYSIPNPTTGDSGDFDVIFSNYFGAAVTSEVRTLTVLAAVPPTITEQPASLTTRYAGAAAPFDVKVVASGAQPFTYQWYRITGGSTNMLSGQTNQHLVLTNVQPADAGDYVVTVGNWLGSDTSDVATLLILEPTPGSYAAEIVANSPWGYWMLDEPYGTTNLHDYYGGHDGWLDPTNSGVAGTNTFTWGVYQQQPAAQLAGFPDNHVGIFVPHNGYEAHAQVPGVTNYVPNMTWMGWIYANAPSANDLGEHGAFIWNRDYGSDSGYGNAFGLTFIENVTGGVTNYNEVAYRWGGPTENPSQRWAGYYHHTGLFASTNSWSFVAVTWAAPNNATVYLGSPTGALSVANFTLPANFDSSYPGTGYTNRYDILLGRSGYPWAEGLTNANDQAAVSLSDVAVFTNALSSAAIQQIYLAAAGELVTYTNSAGNLVVSWPWGTLLSSTNVAGPYAPVPGATSPYTVPTTAPRMFFRVQR